MKTNTSSIAVATSSEFPPNALSWLAEFIRYFAISGAALLLDCSILFVLTYYCGIPYLIAAVAGFSAGLILTYQVSVRWVFKRRADSPKNTGFILFTAIGLFGLLLNDFVLWLGVDVLGHSVEFSKMAAAGVVFSSNFSLRKLILFNQH